jgi:hypothetical protein
MRQETDVKFCENMNENKINFHGNSIKLEVVADSNYLGKYNEKRTHS